MTDQTLKDIDRAFKALAERDKLLGKNKEESFEVFEKRVLCKQAQEESEDENERNDT